MDTVGFFRELGPGQTEIYAESIQVHLGVGPLPDAAHVIQYLREGHTLIDVMGAERDVLGSDRYLVGGASIMTDGQWLWRDDLSFYLASYQVRLPQEFLDAVRANGYRVPELRIEELRRLSREAMRILGYHRPPAPSP
ncbi:hypothetical protein [Micromonospora mirobrigensis]|uniref:Uncharacterized protein n=1 Tax=Micromonospora mirobrigensis TaxID=262898 RepID=A0A1C4WUS3_9ACTN|nr:hypothetical protein [Micromonospora mirobrigensis]SCE99611.1 hypothetical protein GA0070564_102501 [Micromonospora mirobrigensis]